jgi:hypothetical protein
MGVPGNKITDEEATAALKYDLLSTAKYLPQDLNNWIKTENKKNKMAK